MMITLPKSVMVSVNAVIAEHHTINAGLFKFVSMRPVLIYLLAACARLHVFFTHVNPSRLCKRLNPEHSDALTVKQPFHTEAGHA